MKYWVGAILVLVILISGCAPKTAPQPATDNSSNSGRYDSMLSEQFKGWQQTLEIRNLAEWPEGQRKDFILKGVTDAAAWKFVNNNATIEIWARSFSNYEKFSDAEIHITAPIAWKNTASLAYGDVAQVGILNNPDTPDFLFLYASQNNTMFYISYFNSGKNYDATNMPKDKKLLADVGRKLIGRAKEIGANF